MSENHAPLSMGQKKFLSMEGIIIGLLLGFSLVYWGWTNYLSHTAIVETAVAETLLVAAYLTMLVSYVGYKLPVFFPNSPRLSTFCLIVFSGHVSLLFDSFAVVMLLAGGILFIDMGPGSKFNQFVVKVVASFNALTVGGGFYLGELWGLPWFITNDQANLVAGFPILIAATPVCIITAWIASLVVPVKMEQTKMDSVQVRAGIEFVLGLVIIIYTHSAILSIGVLLVYTALRGETPKLLEKTLHELKDGAAVALSLILLALVLTLAGIATIIQPYLSGSGMFWGAVVSSPFAGAIAPAVETLEEFYWGLSYLMLGAPMFVSSSLVAIMVFKDTVRYEEMPDWAKKTFGWVPGMKSRGHAQEAVLYTLIVIPMAVLLAVALWIVNESGSIVHVAEMLGVTMEHGISVH